MSPTTATVQGTVNPDGTLQLDEPLKLPAGRVAVVVQTLAPANPPATGKHWTAAELRKLPVAERDAILAEQAARLEDEYRNNPELSAFDAFGDEDLYVESSDTETR